MVMIMQISAAKYIVAAFSRAEDTEVGQSCLIARLAAVYGANEGGKAGVI